MKLSPEETKKLITYCKQHSFSMQALFYAIQLTIYNKMFNRLSKNEEMIVLMIPYDLRSFLHITTPMIGLYAEDIYLIFPISFINLSIEEMASQLTTFIKSVDSLKSPIFDRYRDGYYNGNLSSVSFPNSGFFSNIGKFTVMERLTSEMKKKFIDFHLSTSTRIPQNSDIVSICIHSFQLFDGSCNLSASYIGKISHEIVINVLEEIRQTIHSLC